MRRTTNLRRLAAALLLVGLTACGGQAVSPERPADLAVGAVSDPESIALANLYAAALRYFGSPAHAEVVADPLAELDSGRIDVVPGFTGRLLQTFAPDAASGKGFGDEQVYKALLGSLPEGITAGDYTTTAEDKPAVAVSPATAADWKAGTGRDLTALVKHCAQVRPGATSGFPAPGVVGSCKLPAAHEFADSAALFAALRAGSINAAWTSTADPAIPDDLVVLVDRKPMLVRAENAVPLYRRNELTSQQVLALNQIAGALDTAALAQIRRKVADGADPRVVADEWLADNPLGR